MNAHHQGERERVTATDRVRRAPVLAKVVQVMVCALAGFALVDVVVGRIDAGTDLREDTRLLRDDYLGWINRTGYWDEKTTISSLGLRSPEIPDDAPADEVRVVGIGPSLVFGAGPDHPAMDEVWAPFLEQRLGAGWRVLNAGVNGYSTVQASRHGVQLLPLLDPDLALVFIDPTAVGLLDQSAAQLTRMWRGRVVPIDLLDGWPETALPSVLALHDALLEYSSLYVRQRAKRSADRRAPSASKFMASKEPIEDPWIRAAYEQALAELAVLGAACDAAGVELRAVITLGGRQYDERRWASYLLANQRRGAPPLGTPRDEPQQALTEAIGALGITCWSLYPVLSTFGDDPEKWTLSDRTHWTREGHEVVAEALYEHMAREELTGELPRARTARPRVRD